MKLIFIPCIIILGILMFLGVQSNAQIFPSFGKTRVATSGMQFLKVFPDARSAGLSGAYHSLTNDASSVYWNPSGITRIDSSTDWDVQCGYSQYFAGTNLAYGGVALRKSPTHFFGFHIISFNSGEMLVTSETNPFGTGQTYSTNSFTTGLTYAQILTDNFSYGVTAKYAYEGFSNVKTQNVLFDLGLQYAVGWQDIRFSVGFNNFGFNVQPSGEVTILKTSGNIAVNNFEAISVPAIFRIGLSKTILKNRDNLLDIAVQLNHPSDNAESYSIGAEYTFRNTLVLRSGYTLGNNYGQAPTLGVGLKLPKNYGRLRIDYGFVNAYQLGNIHRLTLSLGLR